MKNIIEVMRSLPQMESCAPVSEAEIKKAEKELGLSFSDEYKVYVKTFGEVSANGIELTGIIDVAYLNVATSTKEKWQFNPMVPHDLYVVEDTCIDGIIIWQNQKGEIYKSSPNEKPSKIATSLAEYLSNK